ncbi:MAG: glycerol-3-phosphate acyltransferase [Clostridia bacterium]|nr:glycerol-3-phosphate acyltransferase [Clostridia bacterium]
MIYALAASAENTGLIWTTSLEFFLRGRIENQTLMSVVTVCCALLSMILPYLLGSINPAILFSRKLYGEDIRNFGSGNPGTGNMLMTYGGRAAVLTFVCDLTKAALASFLGLLLWGFNGRALAGFFVIFGHMFPIFYRFNGGKGTVCLLAVVLLLQPVVGLILLAIFLVTAIGTRMFSFGALMAALMYPLILQAFYRNADLSGAMAVLTMVFFFFAYRSNIKRIKDGNETKNSFGTVWNRLWGKE